MRPLILFVRHGETDANRAGVLVGRSDFGLTAGGRQASRAVGRMLANAGAAKLLASPLRRAIDSAVVIGKACNLDPEIDERLIEMEYGEWEGRRPRDVAKADWEKWRANVDFRPPGGESMREVFDRVTSFCDEMLDQRSDGIVIAVSHVTPIKCAVAWALQAGPEMTWRMHLSLSSISRVYERDGLPFVASFNETAQPQD